MKSILQSILQSNIVFQPHFYLSLFLSWSLSLSWFLTAYFWKPLAGDGWCTVSNQICSALIYFLLHIYTPFRYLALRELQMSSSTEILPYGFPFMIQFFIKFSLSLLFYVEFKIKHINHTMSVRNILKCTQRQWNNHRHVSCGTYQTRCGRVTKSNTCFAMSLRF